MPNAPYKKFYPDLSSKLIISLIDLIGSDDFVTKLAEALEKQFKFESFHIFLYRKKSAPVAAVNCPLALPYERGLQNYLNYTYVINPTFRAFQAGAESGVYLISDFLQSDSKKVVNESEIEVRIEESEAIGYRTPGWPKNMAECILLVNLPDESALDFTFLTPLGSLQTKECRQSLNQLFPILNSILLRQFSLNRGSFTTGDTAPDQEDRFQNFGGDILTQREREIVQLVLVGHSSDSIGRNLGISLPTVKTHRRNIYSKLQISSQAELFSLFLLHLK